MRSFILALFVQAVALVAPCSAQVFTYQGELNVAGSPANGNYDVEFRVFDAAVGGAQTGIVNAFNAVPVADGLLTASFDAGGGVFTGATRFLDIRVRPTGPGAFTTLTPRQRINAAPYAIRSLNERWTPVSSTLVATDVGVTNVAINRTSAYVSDAALTVSGTTSASGGLLTGVFVGGTDALSRPYYGWFAAGTNLGEARMDGLTGEFRLYVGTGFVTPDVTITPSGNVGIGVTASATDRLTVAGTARATGAITAPSFAYPTPETRTLNIPCTAFQSTDTAHDGNMGGLSVAYLNASVGGGNLIAAVQLPQGATVTNFRVFVLDNSSTGGLTLTLGRRQIGVLPGNTMALVSSAAAFINPAVQTLNDSSVANAVIDNTNFSYFVNVNSPDWQGNVMGIVDAQITYTVPSAD